MNPFVTLLRRTLAGAALVGLAAGAAPDAHAAFITVNAFVANAGDDSDATNGDCTLREAVQAANTDAAVDGCAAGSGSDIIIFDPSANNPTINLRNGEILVTDDLAIEGQNGASSIVTVNAGNQSRHFRVGFNTTLDVSNMVLTNGTADLGGSIRYNVGTSGTLSDVTFLLNRADVSGGAIYNGGDITVSGGEFTSNRALGTTPADGGGAIFNRGSLVVAAGASFTFNKAVQGLGNGGAIFIRDNASASINDNGGAVSFQRNQAARAGGAIESGGTLGLQNVTFMFNRAGINGGALHMSGDADTNAIDGTVMNNRADGEGGGFWNSAGGTLIINGTAFRSNAAQGNDATQGGGGVFSDGGPVNIDGAEFTGNGAGGNSGSGGAINGQGASLTVSNTTFFENTASRAGGAIEIAGGNAYLQNTDYTSNQTARNPGNGGAIHAGGTVTLTVDGGSLGQNQAEEGGAIWISSGTTAFLINNVNISGNTAIGDAASQGGAGFYSDGGSAFLTDVTITDNVANGLEGSGGGINVQGGNLVVDNASIQNNSANRAGGGVEVAGNTIAVIQNSNVLGNRAGISAAGSDRDASPGYGGGVHAGGGTNVTLVLTDVSSNRAVQGGGVWNSGFGEMNVRRSTLSANRAETDGGGLYQAGGLNGTGTLVINESLIAINQAGNKGGGVGSRKAAFEIINSTISGNLSRNGGGLASEQSTGSLLNVTLANNSASNRGGGAWNPDGTMRDDPFVTLSNTIAADNAAPDQDDLYGDYASAGYNLVETATAPEINNDPTNIIGQDPLLGPPANNGGPTFTHALLAGSPAIDAGQSSVAVDQRGYGRPVGADDIGAFEFGATPIVEDPEVASAKTGAAAGEYALGVATPNPVATTSRLALSVGQSEAVRAVVYDALGRQVATVFEGMVQADTPVSLEIDASSLSTGVYIVRVVGETFARSQQITVVR